ncbi:unnamed protein product, partial [Ilex paraguariensis]
NSTNQRVQQSCDNRSSSNCVASTQVAPQRGNTTAPQLRPNVGTSNAKKQSRWAIDKCFKCGAPRHKSAECQKVNSREGKQLLVEEYGEEEQNNQVKTQE